MNAGNELRLPPSASTTLVVVLGASEFPDSKFLRSFPEFKKAAFEFLNYILDEDGFGLPRDNLRSFFDLRMDPNTLDANLSAFIRERRMASQTARLPIRDLIVY